MKKNVMVMVMAAALAVSQGAVSLAATSPNTYPIIVPGDSSSDGTTSGSSSGGSSSSGSSAAGASSAATVGSQSASQLSVSTAGGTATHNGGQAVVGDTGIEFVQGSADAVIGLPATVVSSINAINSGSSLADAGTGIDLTGYSALVGTTAVMTYQAGTRTEKTGAVSMPLYVPNLVDGLGTVQVLFYNNMTGVWQLINPTSVDTASKMVYVTIPNSGTFSVVYKR